MKKLEARFYYVDGSEQYITINTDSLQLAIEDCSSKLSSGETMTFDGDNGAIYAINSKNVINIKFNIIEG